MLHTAVRSSFATCFFFFFFARGRKDEVMVGSHFCVKQDLKWLMAPETLLWFFLFMPRVSAVDEIRSP